MTITLKAEPRAIFGKALQSYREAGQLPVVLYGPKEDATALFVEAKAFAKVFKEAGESSVISLEVNGDIKDTLVKDVAVHPVSGDMIHVDFYAIEKGKKVEVAVPLVFTGEAPAVKTLGGTLVKVLYELEIKAMPKDLPHEIEVSVESLIDFDSRILVKDIKLPAGVEVCVDAEEVIALASQAGEEVTETSEPVDLSAIEVEKKGKKEEEVETEAGE